MKLFRAASSSVTSDSSCWVTCGMTRQERLSCSAAVRFQFAHPLPLDRAELFKVRQGRNCDRFACRRLFTRRQPAHEPLNVFLDDTTLRPGALNFPQVDAQFAREQTSGRSGRRRRPVERLFPAWRFPAHPTLIPGTTRCAATQALRSTRSCLHSPPLCRPIDPPAEAFPCHGQPRPARLLRSSIRRPRS